MLKDPKRSFVVVVLLLRTSWWREIMSKKCARTKKFQKEQNIFIVELEKVTE